MRKMKLLSVMILLLTLTLLFSCTKDSGNQYLVEISGQGLAKDFFIKRFKLSQDFDQSEPMTSEKVRSYIEKNIIEDLYFLAEAYNKKFDRDSLFITKLENEKIRLLTKRDGLLYEKIIPEQFELEESDIQWVYEHSHVTLKLAHIVVNSPILADSLSRLLDNGANFSDLAKEYSVDYVSARNGGVIERKFVVGMLGKDFESVAFKLESNQISKPIKTFMGYHLIKVLDRVEEKVKPFEEVKDRMHFIARKIKLSELINNYILGLYEKFNFTINDDMIPKIINSCRFENNKHEILKDTFTESELSLKIVTYDSGELTLDSFIDEYNRAHESKKTAFRYPEDVREFLVSSMGIVLMYQDAKFLGLDQNENFLEEFLNVKNRLLLRLTKDKLVYSQVEIDEKDLKEAFEANKVKWKDRSFDEVKPILNNMVKTNKTRELYSQIVSELKKKYRADYNESLIEEAVEEINALKSNSSS